MDLFCQVVLTQAFSPPPPALLGGSGLRPPGEEPEAPPASDQQGQIIYFAKCLLFASNPRL